MARPFLLTGLTGLALLVAAPATRADDDDDPTFQGRKLTEWLKIMNSGPRLRRQQQVVGCVLGSASSHPAVWAGPTRYRQASLIVAELVGPSKNREVLPAVTAALREDPDERIRASAASVLGRMHKKALEGKVRFDEAREALAIALRPDKEPSGRVREAVAKALGQLSAEEVRAAVPALADALQDPHVGTRLAAADTLRRVGKVAVEALPKLQQVLQDKKADPLLRTQAALALGRIGAPDAVASLPVLKEVLGDTKAPDEVRQAAAETLGQLGKDGAEAAPLLGKVLTSKEPVALRRAAAGALDQLGAEAKAVLPDLKKALKDPDKFVRCLVMHALGQLGNELGDDTRPVVALLIEAMGDNIVDVRVAAMETLATLGPETLGPDAKTVLAELKKATNDGKKGVREAAQNALKRLTAKP
jgi:HEAT repeat protein